MAHDIHLNTNIAEKISTHKIDLKDEIRFFQHWKLCSECRKPLLKCMHKAGFTLESDFSHKSIFTTKKSVNGFTLYFASTKSRLLCLSADENNFNKLIDRSNAEIICNNVPLFISSFCYEIESYFKRGIPFEYPDIYTALISSHFALEVLFWTWLIPFGQTATYSEIARWIGKPKAARSVGAALHKNPIAIVVPCHRVIGANGSLVGFAGGIEMKRHLLNLEAESLKNFYKNNLQIFN
jgi:O-6-methylguanine DNA methyltransferase